MFATLLSYLGFADAQKLALRLWVISTLAAFVLVLWTAGQSCAQFVCGPLISGITLVHPYFAIGLSLGFNTVTYGLASCYMTVWAACQMYIYKKRILDMMK